MTRAGALLLTVTIVASHSASTLARYADSTTHVTLITRAITLAGRDGYAEIETFKAPIRKGAIEEDSGDPIVRFANHFFDPSTGQGMPQNWYATAYEGRVPFPTDNVRYRSAYDWGKGGTPDDLDWDGAIEAYDYTAASRDRAYEALGHVVHLVQDMAQPDHATCRPHPGSYSHDTVAGATTATLHGARKQLAEFLFPSNRIGFEALWAIKNGDWPEGKEAKKPRDLYDAFVTMGNEAKQAERQLGLPSAARGEMALGLRAYSSARADKGGMGREAIGEVVTYVTEGLALLWQLEQYQDFQDDMWMHFELNVPIVPTIPWPATSQTTPYIELGQKLLPIAEERSAGLLQYFHDIVNVPPYVEAVSIEQEDGPKYHARWQDATSGIHVTGRTLVKEGGAALKPRTPATVRVTFGPTLLVGGREYREGVDKVKVWFEPAGMSFGGQDPPAQYLIPGGFERGAGGSSSVIWKGQFFPDTAGGRLRIRAEDLDQHLASRAPLGNQLDGNPADAARAQLQAGYPWTAYQPGDDLNHRIGAASGCAWCEATPDLLKTRWGAIWKGTIRVVEEVRRPDDGSWAMFFDHKVDVTFRSLANAEATARQIPIVTLRFGHAEGTFDAKWQRGRYDPLRTATVTPVLAGGMLIGDLAARDHNHTYFMVFRPHPLNLPEDQIPGAPYFSDYPAGREGVLSGKVEEDRGTVRTRTEWTFTMTETVMPPHLAAVERMPTGEELGAYHTHVWTVLKPLTSSGRLSLAEINTIVNLMTEPLNAWTLIDQGEDRTKIRRTFDEATDAWLSEEPGNEDALYASKTAELGRLIDAWLAKLGAVERRAADATDRAAAIVARASGDLAQRLRESAQKLRTQGARAFGGSTR